MLEVVDARNQRKRKSSNNQKLKKKKSILKMKNPLALKRKPKRKSMMTSMTKNKMRKLTVEKKPRKSSKNFSSNRTVEDLNGKILHSWES
jgi:hypothetical protein